MRLIHYSLSYNFLILIVKSRILFPEKNLLSKDTRTARKNCFLTIVYLCVTPLRLFENRSTFTALHVRPEVAQVERCNGAG